jgi:hypothetical protein
MEWFKHSTASHDDPDLSDAMDEFGHAGYSSFFILLELYAEEYHHLDSEGFLRLSLKFVARNLRLSSTKVPKLLNFYSERGRILFKIEGNYVYLKSPKFDVIASNWVSRKKAKQDRTPTEAPTEGATEGPTAIEVEEEVDKEKKKKHICAPDPSFDSFFNDFWNIYPGRNGKKIGKDQCREYCKRFKNGEREQILAGVKNYAASRQAVEGFAKDPIRFLKNKAWHDWQEPEHDPSNAYDW